MSTWKSAQAPRQAEIRIFPEDFPSKPCSEAGKVWVEVSAQGIRAQNLGIGWERSSGSSWTLIIKSILEFLVVSALLPVFLLSVSLLDVFFPFFEEPWEAPNEPLHAGEGMKFLLSQQKLPGWSKNLGN